MNENLILNDTIDWDGDTWNVQEVGVSRGNETYCHLASTTRFRQQRNGACPIQRACFVPDDVLFVYICEECNNADAEFTHNGRVLCPNCFEASYNADLDSIEEYVLGGRS